MLNCPSKFFSFYLIAILFSFSISGFCAQGELTQMQEQARNYHNQGWKLQKDGNIDGALSCYQKALLADPGYVAAYNDAGVIFEDRGQPEQAVSMYRKAIEIAPDYPNSYSNLALLYEGQKDYSNALVYWVKRATLGEPSDPWTAAARKRVEDFAHTYPEIYRNITKQYKEKIQQSDLSQTPSKEYKLSQSEEYTKLREADRKKEEIAFQKKRGKELLLKETEQERLKREEEKRLQKEKEQEEKQLAKGKSQVEKSLSSEEAIFTQETDDKARALKYLESAKKSFSKGDYVVALKEATVAEYFDSSNTEISAFVNKIRKKILH